MRVESFLDYNEILRITFEITDEGISYDLSCDTGDKRLGEAIIKNLKEITTLEQTENPDIYRLSVGGSIFIDISKSTGEIKNINKLTAFETRLLSQGKTKDVPFERTEESEFTPKTDLHTHFAGALTPEILIQVGKNHNIKYPAKLLEKVGIDINNYYIDENGNVELNSLTDSDIEILKEGLKIPQVTQETFNKMEEIYALRGPFTKNKELFPDLLYELAKDYKDRGIEYAELSFSAFLSDPEYMQMLEDNLPQIEEKTGVKLRFLAGLWRHSDKEWNLDDTDRLISIAESPYIVGADFMGHETNETKNFQEELEMLAEYAMLNDPEFTIRVHAGENPIFKNNVYQAIKIIHDKHAEMEKKLGKKLPMPKVRIGHGLYGLDGIQDEKHNDIPPEEILALLKEMGVIVEFNMSSNLALNNINSISEIPIKRYLDAGVKVVLSTDGHGLYSTSGSQEVILAKAAGLTDEDLEKIKQTEKEVMEAQKKREKTHPPIKDVGALYDGIVYSTENGEKRYTKEVAEQKKLEKEAKCNELLDAIKNKAGAVVDPKKIEEATKGKVPIMITGASMNAWDKIDRKNEKGHRRNIALTMQVLANVLDPEKAYIVTGGTNFGVEKTMHEAVHRRNEQRGDQMVLLGTFTMEAHKDLEEGIQPDTITHATILRIGEIEAQNWMDLPETQLVYTKQNGGYMIGIGGGSIVSDIIQRGYNLDMDMHLMDGPEGASTDKSKSLAGNGYSFTTTRELLERLYQRNPDMFCKGFSLENIEEYIREAELQLDQELEQEKPDNFGLESIAKIDGEVTSRERVEGTTTLEQGVRETEDKENSEIGEGTEDKGDSGRGE